MKERRIVMENMFEKGCLVQLSISKWGGVKKINDNQLAEMIDTHEWLTATKKLVDPDSLKPICKVGNAARTYLTSISLPFPIQGMVFIPKEMISRVDQRLEEFKAEFNQTITTFLHDYDRLRETAMVYLQDLFNEVDYPVHVREEILLCMEVHHPGRAQWQIRYSLPRGLRARKRKVYPDHGRGKNHGH